MTTDKQEIGLKLFSLLPPSMDNKDLTKTIGHFKTLNAWSDQILMNHDIKICKREATSSTGSISSSQLEHVKRKLEAYQQSLYIDKGLQARYTIVDKEKNEIEIRTYTEIIDANNCIDGSWSSLWNFTILTEKSANMMGDVMVHVHYYENGCNVQTKVQRTYESRTVSTKEEKVNALVKKFEKEKMSYEEQLANVMINSIQEYELCLFNDIQEQIQPQNVYDNTLKRIRRILPITKTRFKWDTAAQKQVKLLLERTSTH